MEFTSSLPSPELLRKWSGISLIAAALERKVWIKTGIGVLYPNLYVVLVAPPGVGKTILTSQVWSLLNELSDSGDPNGFHLASSSLTSASIVDDLREAHRRVILPGMDIASFNALTICSNELGVLLPEYDNSFMSKLTDIYDGHPYSERRRTKELNFKIDAPQLNLLAATSPSYLNDIIPEGAWDQGFLSRTLIVYAGEKIKRGVFAEVHTQDDLRKTLVLDLRQIFAQYGAMKFTPEAAEMIEHWNDKGQLPVPEHPKLMHYLTRRLAHFLKLCMVACAASGASHVITADHVRIALDWLVEMEFYLVDIFKAMVVGGDRKAMEETWYHVAQIFARENKPVAEQRIIAYLAERVPAHNVGRILEVMVKAGILVEKFEGVGNYYVPKAKKPGT